MKMPVATDLAVDRELASISESFRFLVDLTPINVEEARKDFLASPEVEPAFIYRDVEDFPEVIGARLAAVDIGSVVDTSLAEIFMAKRRELSLQLRMLSVRGSSEFRDLSVEVYGSVTPVLVGRAESILVEVPKTTRRRRHCLDAQDIARVALAEIERYREGYPDLSVVIEIRDDISGVMVANGALLIGATATVANARIAGLLAHEVGTHVLTYINGSLQPLKLMASGLAGYEQTQEGLALIAEAAVGGLTGNRLRQIAARVVAVRRLLQGWTFAQAHDELTDRFGYSAGGAFTIIMRVWRSGGLTKDAVYLRGLQELVDHVSTGNRLDLLWQGKMSLVDLPLVGELTKQGVLQSPALIPNFLSDATAIKRIKRVAGDAGLHYLIGA